MFKVGLKVGYGNCQELVWALYSDLSLDRLPTFSMDVVAFIIETRMANLNPYRYMGSDTCRTYHGVSSQMDSPGGLGTVKDQSLFESVDSEDEGDQSIEVGILEQFQ